jgi:glycosyltransferase involved in cell wall biosynthesis
VWVAYDPRVPPLVSVVVPFYQQAAFARETVESVLGQDYPELEVILADDGSTDGTVSTLRSFEDPRVRILEAPVNRGIAANFNAGLQAANGEYIAILGGDDVMLPGKLEAQVQTLEAHPEAVACVHDAEVFASADGRVLGRFSELYNGRRGVRSGGVELQFDATYFMLPSAMMFRRAAAPPGGYDERLKFANDWLWTVELLRRGPILGSDEVLVRYRRHEGNITASAQTRMRILEEGLIALAVVEARYPELHRLVRRRAAAFGLAAVRESVSDRDWCTALRRTRQTLSWAGPFAAVMVARRMLGARSGRGGDPPA